MSCGGEETPEVATNSGMSNISLLPFTLDHPHLRACHIHHSRSDQRAMFELITIKPVGHVSTSALHSNYYLQGG